MYRPGMKMHFRRLRVVRKSSEIHLFPYQTLFRGISCSAQFSLSWPDLLFMLVKIHWIIRPSIFDRIPVSNSLIWNQLNSQFSLSRPMSLRIPWINRPWIFDGVPRKTWARTCCAERERGHGMWRPSLDTLRFFLNTQCYKASHIKPSF